MHFGVSHVVLPWSVSEVPVPPGLMKQAREFAAAGAGWREMEASTIPLCPGEFGFKSVSLGVQTLAKCGAYYFPLMKSLTCFVIVLLSSRVSFVSCTPKCQSRLDFSMLLSCSLEDLHVPRRQ